MIIKVVCPVCKANNELTARALFCRRCREDLSLLYSVKGYSYKYRLWAVQFWAQKMQKESLDVADIAFGLDKS
jgi:hypothetical protein